MKHLLTVLFSIIFSGHCYSQQIKEIKEVSLVNTLGNIDTAFFRKTKQMVISVYRLNNGPGSANFRESDEVSHNLLISVSEYGEYPANKVFSLGPFINPVILEEKDLADKYVFSIRHGAAKKRKVNKALLSVNKVIYQ
jgi:hypothetical protein